MTVAEELTYQQEGGNEVLALGRMVSYVCQRSKALNLGMSTYFLEMAVMSLANDIDRLEPSMLLVPSESTMADLKDLH